MRKLFVIVKKDVDDNLVSLGKRYEVLIKENNT